MAKKKYEKGQTWPVGAFRSGLMLTYSDKELREGYMSHKNVEMKKRIRGRDKLEVEMNRLLDSIVVLNVNIHGENIRRKMIILTEIYYYVN